MTKNHIELIGFAGQAPKRTGSGDTAPVKLSLATTDRWRDASGQRQERTEARSSTRYSSGGDWRTSPPSTSRRARMCSSRAH